MVKKHFHISAFPNYYLLHVILRKFFNNIFKITFLYISIDCLLMIFYLKRIKTPEKVKALSMIYLSMIILKPYVLGFTDTLYSAHFTEVLLHS